MGLCPIAPPKGFPFSIVCFCHWQQQPKTSLETFGRKYFVFILEIPVFRFLLYRILWSVIAQSISRGNALSVRSASGENEPSRSSI